MQTTLCLKKQAVVQKPHQKVISFMLKHMGALIVICTWLLCAFIIGYCYLGYREWHKNPDVPEWAGYFYYSRLIQIDRINEKHSATRESVPTTLKR